MADLFKKIFLLLLTSLLSFAGVYLEREHVPRIS